LKGIILFFAIMSSSLLFGQTATLPAGAGTSANPYLIATLNNLYWITVPGTVNGLTQTQRWAFNIYYRQTANIDAIGDSLWDSGQGWLPIGTAAIRFYGKYDGQGHTISHIFVNRPSTDEVGLFGFVSSGASITNLGVINLNITGLHDTGGLMGGNQNTVTNCYTTGIVISNQYGGGLIGSSGLSGNVSNCYSTCTVTGTNATYGGLIGENTATVTNCYATGDVISGGSDNANFISRSTGTVSYCYATGNVQSLTTNGFGSSGFLGTFSANFFDRTTSGQTTGYGATAKTTAEMKTSSTFTGAGWDSNIWNLDPSVNNGYPSLKWQNPGGSPLPVELTSFSAIVVSKNIVNLNWKTATEVKNFGFDVERSNTVQASDIKNWTKVGFVPGNGTSNSTNEYSFTDKSTTTGNYIYRLKQIDNDGKFVFSKEVEVDLMQLPTEFSLEQNYPNPFNPTTSIKYSVAGNQYVSLKVYDILGNEIATVVNEVKQTGTYTVAFDGSKLASGVYIYKLQSSSLTQTKKFILMK
jgi:hypothetical protein